MDVRQKILSAAAELFAAAGYRGTTTRRIAQRAGVNEVTLFRHFGSKAELILEAIRCYAPTGTTVGLPEVAQDPRAELTAFARSHMDHLRRYRALIRTCLGESAEHPELVQRMKEGPLRTRREVRRYLEQLKAEGHGAGAVNMDGVAAVFLGALFADVMSRDLMPELYGFSEDEAAAVYVDVVLRSLYGAGEFGTIPSNGAVDHGQDS